MYKRDVNGGSKEASDPTKEGVFSKFFGNIYAVFFSSVDLNKVDEAINNSKNARAGVRKAIEESKKAIEESKEARRSFRKECEKGNNMSFS